MDSLHHADSAVKTPRTPISSVSHYVPGIQWPVAWTDTARHLLHKAIRDQHMVARPQAIAFDVAVMDESEKLGATDIRVTHRDRGTIYACTIETFRKHGFPIRRGHGSQWALPLDWFSIDSQTPVAEAKRHAQAAAASDNGQLTLFAFTEPQKLGAY